MHQTALDYTALQSYVLDSARTSSIISQNKEGLVSLPGYLSIYLLGLATGLYTLPPYPGYYKRLHSSKKSAGKDESERPGKLIFVLASWGIVWSAAFGTLYAAGWNVSRRLVSLLLASIPCDMVEGLMRRCVQANLPYVLWITAFNTCFLALYLVVHTWAERSHPSRTSGAPKIFQVLNKNGLVVFLAVSDSFIRCYLYETGVS